MAAELTQLGVKRKIEEHIRDAPQKKAKVKLMKDFAHDYIDECNKLKILFVLINITKKKRFSLG